MRFETTHTSAPQNTPETFLDSPLPVSKKNPETFLSVLELPKDPLPVQSERSSFVTQHDHEVLPVDHHHDENCECEQIADEDILLDEKEGKHNVFNWLKEELPIFDKLFTKLESEWNSAKEKYPFLNSVAEGIKTAVIETKKFFIVARESIVHSKLVLPVLATVGSLGLIAVTTIPFGGTTILGGIALFAPEFAPTFLLVGEWVIRLAAITLATVATVCYRSYLWKKTKFLFGKTLDGMESLNTYLNKKTFQEARDLVVWDWMFTKNTPHLKKQEDTEKSKKSEQV